MVSPASEREHLHPLPVILRRRNQASIGGRSGLCYPEWSGFRSIDQADHPVMLRLVIAQTCGESLPLPPDGERRGLRKEPAYQVELRRSSEQL